MTKFDEFGLPEPTKYPQMPKVIKMNERIKQLAEQAGCKVMDGEWYIPSATGLEKIVYTKGIGLEKFAELIVRDCMDVVDGYTKPRTFNTHYDAVEQIEALFGIKHNRVEE